MSLKVAATVQDSVSQSVVSVHDGLVSPGILLEMQILRAYPRTTESKSWEVGPRTHVLMSFSCHLFILQFKNHKWRRFISLSAASLELYSIAQLLLHSAFNFAVPSSFCFLWGSLHTANNVSAADFLTDLRKKGRIGYIWKLHYRNKESSLQQSLFSCASWATLGHRTVHKHGTFCYTIYKHKF